MRCVCDLHVKCAMYVKCALYALCAQCCAALSGAQNLAAARREARLYATLPPAQLHMVATVNVQSLILSLMDRAGCVYAANWDYDGTLLSSDCAVFEPTSILCAHSARIAFAFSLVRIRIASSSSSSSSRLPL